MERLAAKYKGVLQSLGPSLLWAGAAVGVSHLVQSTRAGASYNFLMVWAIVLALLFKYPFFEYGPRYAAATGESLLEGYKKMGPVTLGLFVFITVTTMFTVVAAVTLVTASLVANLLNPVVELNLGAWSLLLLVVCMLILMVGRYALLDKIVKFIIVLLSISTVAAVVVALRHGAAAAGAVAEPSPLGPQRLLGTIAFIVVLMGWMPSPIDLSVWNSIWTLERSKETGHKPTVREALIDFNIAYFVTAVLALCFLALGALVMYGSGVRFARSGIEFASQFVNLYTSTLGQWSYPIISVAALSTMFSTTITCTDAYPRVLRRAWELVFPDRRSGPGGRRLYWIWMVVVIAGSVLLIYAFLNKQMTFMVDLATTISFLTAPVLGYINYRLVTSRYMPSHAVPSWWLRVLSLAGLAFLTAFSIVFVYCQLFLR